MYARSANHAPLRHAGKQRMARECTKNGEILESIMPVLSSPGRVGISALGCSRHHTYMPD
jgi:hypothetical protein